MAGSGRGAGAGLSGVDVTWSCGAVQVGKRRRGRPKRRGRDKVVNAGVSYPNQDRAHEVSPGRPAVWRADYWTRRVLVEPGLERSQSRFVAVCGWQACEW